MKIAVDCRMSGKSGIGTFFDGILPYLKESGNELFLFGTEEIPCGIKMFSLKETFCFPKSLLKKINSYDIYFTPYCNIPNGIKIPIYSSIHDIVFLDVKGLSGKIGTFARKLFYKRAVKKSKAIFTVSNFSKTRIQKKLNCKKPIYVVYNGIPHYLEQPISPLPEKNDTLIFVGNIKKHKGLSTLLKAFPKIHKETGAKLLIVGSQENFRTQDESVATKIEKINSEMENSIEFTGFVENEKLKHLLASAKILVQPSLYEGFGIPPLEALSCKTNAVISDIPVFREIYANLPVTFFKSEDSDDLAEKVCEVWKNAQPVPDFENPYSYEKTAKFILDEFN